MDIGIFRGVVTNDRLNHTLWLLRGRGIIKIDERLTVNFPRKDWEFGTDFVHIEIRRSRRLRLERCICGGHPTSSQPRGTSSGGAAPAPAGVDVPGSQPCTRSCRYSRTGWHFMRSRHSLAKASSRIPRAEDSSIPRERM